MTGKRKGYIILNIVLILIIVGGIAFAGTNETIRTNLRITPNRSEGSSSVIRQDEQPKEENPSEKTESKSSSAKPGESSSKQEEEPPESEISEETAEEPIEEMAIVSLDELEPGDILQKEQMDEKTDLYFRIYEIEEGDPVYERILNKSYHENENIGLEDLRYIKMLHYNFEHQIQTGEMITNAAICEDALKVFQELFEAEYEIESMYLIDNYWVDDALTTDDASIEANNTSCFCYREITRGDTLSYHALGRAIDLNPRQNPYFWHDEEGNLQWIHENADLYMDREQENPHIIIEDDICYTIFEKYGFEWGGTWDDPIDYQHFEKTTNSADTEVQE